MKNYMTIILLFAFTYSFCQEEKQNFHNGFVYLKLKENNAPFPGISDFKDFKKAMPNFNEIINSYEITSIKCPFKTQTKKIQSIYYVEFNKYNKIDDLIIAFEKSNIVKYAEKAPIYKFSATPNDDSLSSQWSLEKIQAELAWDYGTGSSEVKIAVLDAAFKLDHEDLQANVWINTAEIEGNGIDDDGNGYIDDINGWDVGDDDNDTYPPIGNDIDANFGHGTFVAGVAAGVTNNNIGMASISHNVKFIPIKISQGTTTLSIPAGVPPLGIDYAIINNVDFINMSFGSLYEEDMGATMQTLVQEAYNNNIILLAATGNAYQSNIDYPAKYPEVIAVGATDINDYKWSWSNYSIDVDIMAPGVDIFSTIQDEPKYASTWSGTSFSTPMTCATLALMKSNYPLATVEELKECLYSGADNIDNVNTYYLGRLGHGRLNAYKSMRCMDSLSNITQIENQDIFIKNKVLIYPNPTTNHFTIYNSEFTINTVEIFDIAGKVIFETAVADTKQKININILNKGIYIAKIYTLNGIISKRIVVY